MYGQGGEETIKDYLLLLLLNIEDDMPQATQVTLLKIHRLVVRVEFMYTG